MRSGRHPEKFVDFAALVRENPRGQDPRFQTLEVDEPLSSRRRPLVPAHLNSILYYAAVILLVGGIIVGVASALRARREAREGVDLASEAEMLSEFQRARDAGEMDDAEFRRVRDLLISGKSTRRGRAPRYRAEPRDPRNVLRRLLPRNPPRPPTRREPVRSSMEERSRGRSLHFCVSSAGRLPDVLLALPLGRHRDRAIDGVGVGPDPRIIGAVLASDDGEAYPLVRQFQVIDPDRRQVVQRARVPPAWCPRPRYRGRGDAPSLPHPSTTRSRSPPTRKHRPPRRVDPTRRPGKRPRRGPGARPDESPSWVYESSRRDDDAPRRARTSRTGRSLPEIPHLARGVPP